MEEKKELEPPVAPEPPLWEQIVEYYRSINVPFFVCRRIQIWLMSLVLTSYFCYVFVILVWPLRDHTLVSSRCGRDFPQWTVDLTYKKQGESFKKDDITYENKHTWVYETKTKKFIRGCPCQVKKCVRKCCPKNEKFDSPDNRKCVLDNSFSIFDNLTGHIYPLPESNESSLEIDIADYHTISGLADCSKYYGFFGALYEVLEESATLLEDGRAITKDNVFLDIDDYCIEHSIVPSTLVTMRCVKVSLMHEAKSWMARHRPEREWTALLLTLASLIAILSVYYYVPQLRDLHGMMVITYISFMMFYYLQLLADQQKIPVEFEYLRQYTYIGSFCWLTALGFDVWILFSGPLQLRTKRQEMRQFIWYNVICYGCPAILCTVTWLVGVLPYHWDQCKGPRFEDDTCKFTMERTTRLFYSLPLLVMIALNVVMYLSTLYNIKREQVSTKKVFCGSPCNHLLEFARRGFLLYTRMAKVVGFCGVCLLLLTTPYNKKCTFFHDHLIMFYYSQGILLLLAICCNKRTVRMCRIRSLELKIRREEEKALIKAQEQAEKEEEEAAAKV